MRRRTRSEKVSESAARTINFSTPMGLSFEHTRAVGARASEKKIVEWWGSAEQHAFDLNEHKDHFKHNTLPLPKPYWTANKRIESASSMELDDEFLTEEKIVESILNDADDFICNDNVLSSKSDYKLGNKIDKNLFRSR